MITYFDSSFLLSIVFQDRQSKQATKVWVDSEIRVSSILLEAECFTVLRRTQKLHPKKITTKALKSLETRLTEILEEIELCYLDERILSILKKEPKLSQCRTFDALHLATALYFASRSEEHLHIATFDKDMANLARELRLL